jgi:hypothetical protein
MLYLQWRHLWGQSSRFCDLFTTPTYAHTVHNGTISISATCFGDYVTIIWQYTTGRYLKLVKIWHTFVSQRYSQTCLRNNRHSDTQWYGVCVAKRPFRMLVCNSQRHTYISHWSWSIPYLSLYCLMQLCIFRKMAYKLFTRETVSKV